MPDWLVIVIFVAGFLFYRFVIKKGVLRMYEETIRMYSGTVGSGKTYNGVADALEAYRKQEKRYKHHNNLLWRIFCPACKHEPHLISNIPIKLGRRRNPETKKWETVWSEPLRKEHFLVKEKVPKHSVIFVDEVGSFASQWDFDNPYVREQLQTFMRYFRHWVEGTMILTDQSVSRVCKPIRELIGRVYWLSDFHRMWVILPFCEIYCVPMVLLEDTVTNSVVTQEANAPRIIRRLLPYKWMRWTRKYDSTCYSELYDNPAEREISCFTGFKTCYLIDMQVAASVQKAYKQNRDIFHNWLYRHRPWNPPPSADETQEPPKAPPPSLPPVPPSS